MELQIEAPKVIEDGRHQGVIVDIKYRTDPYKYVDLVIEFEDEQKIQVGYPQKCMKESKLGKLLSRFGVNLPEGGSVNPNKELVGKLCFFTTIREGKYARVIPESVRPIEETIK